MSSRSIVTLCVALALGVATAAQQPPAAKPTQEQPAPPPRPDPFGQPINLRVELAITDQIGTGDAVKKSVTMLVADRARASIRNDGATRGFVNADAQPHVLPSGAVRLALGLEYMPTVVGQGGEGSRTLSRLHEQTTVVLESGKSMVISQSADPASERKVTVQVTVTVVR